VSELARRITRAASLQTYYTIALLVERRRRDDAYRAYAYFRWVDDYLDNEDRPAAERLEFAERQRVLIERCYAGDSPEAVSREERMLIDLVRANPDPRSSLAAYVNNMMSVMAFDAGRRGRLISQAELAAYQRSLAVSVTEAMYYFFGGNESAPRTPQRYLSVTAAHITHMLRDTHEDLDAGYFNIPAELLRQHNLAPHDVDAPAYLEWVRMRVDLAREYFRLGKCYLRLSASARSRLAAYAYAARFEVVLDMMEADGYRLRKDYGVRRTLRAGLRMAGAVLLSLIGFKPELRLAGGDGCRDEETGSE